MGNKYFRILRMLAMDRVITPQSAENLLNASAEDGGPGSGNFGHHGRIGKVGGSAPSVSEGVVAGNLGKNSSGQQYVGKEYSLPSKGLRSITRRKGKDGRVKWSGPGRTWISKGKKSKLFPKGSGSTKLSEQDVGIGLHTINKYLQEDGTLTPERAALHERIIQKLFKNAKRVPEGEQPVCYFLGGGSASGKSNFTTDGKREAYGMPGKEETPVLDADELKNEIPEYQYDPKTGTGTGTTNRELAASFAHEESSALVKRAMQAAIDNRYNFTLDGTGDGSASKMISKIQSARNMGYRVEGKYCTREIDDAIESNLERAIKSGRNVQIDSLVQIHKEVSKIVPQIAKEFDHFELWDHNGSKPVLIAYCDRGQDLKYPNNDDSAYKKFIRKQAYERNLDKEREIIERLKKKYGKT